MHFNNLPVEIIRCIVKKLVTRRKLNFVQWKDTLPLLAVSQLWRHISLPLIGAYIIVECVENYELDEVDGEGTDSSIDTGEDDDAAGMLWLSNIEFIELLNSPHCVKVLMLYHEAPANSFTYLTAVGKQLAPYARLFKSVEFLDITFLPLADTNDNESSDDEATAADLLPIELLATQIIAIMPNIVKLVTKTHGMYVNDPAMTTFCCRIIKAFAHQLRVCQCFFSISLESIRFSSQLQTANFILDTGAITNTPSIDPTSLTQLWLDNLPAQFPYKWFNTKLTPGYIMFDNITSLGLRCRRDPLAADTTLDSRNALDPKKLPKLRFPKLRALRLELCHNSYMQMFSDWNITSLQSLIISGTLAHIQRFPFHYLTWVGSISLFISSAPKHKQDEFYKVTNYFNGHLGNPNNCILILHTFDFDLCPEKLYWPNLTALQINQAVELASIIACLPKLPNLHDLDLILLCFNNLPDAIGDCTSPAWQELVCSPMDTNLSALTLDTCFQSVTEAFATSILLYFMARIVKLKSLQTSSKYHKLLDAAVSRQKATHPHMEFMRIVYSSFVG